MLEQNRNIFDEFDNEKEGKRKEKERKKEEKRKKKEEMKKRRKENYLESKGVQKFISAKIMLIINTSAHLL